MKKMVLTFISGLLLSYTIITEGDAVSVTPDQKETGNQAAVQLRQNNTQQYTGKPNDSNPLDYNTASGETGNIVRGPNPDWPYTLFYENGKTDGLEWTLYNRKDDTENKEKLRKKINREYLELSFYDNWKSESYETGVNETANPPFPWNPNESARG